MMRNKEIRRYIYASISMTLLAAVLTYFVHPVASIIVFLVGIALVSAFLIYTHKRYNDISSLSHYLRKIMSGEYDIEVRNNEEGELSILRNEIFKLTSRLQEQHEYVSEDRNRMAEALADISHQLKTPLTSMQMMVDLIEDDRLPREKRKEFLANIQTQLERMDWLVKVLLKLSKLDAGTVQFYKQQVSLEAIVKTAINAVQVGIMSKHIEVHLPNQTAPHINVDEKWMLEAVLNVLKNAVDHTNEHGVITIEWMDNPIVSSLTIHNTGRAIDKSELPYLFKRFYKGKNSSEASVGIGLSLSLQIMEAHNGTIEVNSEEQKGTSFHLKWYKRR